MTALLIAAGQLATFGVLSRFSFEGAAFAWGGAYGTVILYDLIGAQLAVRSFNRGVRRSRAFQIGSGLLAIATAGSVAFVLGTRAPDWEPRHLLPGNGEPIENQYDIKRYGDDYDPWIDPFSAPVPRRP
jgi:hypothetical protein